MTRQQEGNIIFVMVNTHSDVENWLYASSGGENVCENFLFAARAFRPLLLAAALRPSFLTIKVPG